MAADKRLLWRAALFLWMIFLSAMLSSELTEFWYTACAADLSPASMALVTFLIAVRNSERRLLLCAFCLTAWRARLRACAVLAIRAPRNSACYKRRAFYALFVSFAII